MSRPLAVIIAFACLACAACGRCSFETLPVGPDAGGADADVADADTVTDGAGPDAGRPAWQPPAGYELLEGMPAGGELRDFAFSASDPSRMYASSARARVFYTTDQGLRWFECGRPDGYFSDLAVAPDDPMHVFLTDGGGILRSRDGCATWQLDEFTDSGDSLAVAPDGALLAGVAGLRRWNGVAWDLIPSPFDAVDIDGIAVGSDSRTWLIGGAGVGVALSTDAGGSWEVRNGGLTSDRIQDLAIDPVDALRMYASTADGLFQSVDGAMSWNGVAGGQQTVAIHPTDTDFVVFMANNDLRTSDDGLMTSMGDVRSPNMNVSTIMRLRFDPTDPARVLAAGTRGFFTDQARRFDWQERSQGIYAWTITDLALGQDGTLWVGTQAGVMSSSDAGTTFAYSTEGLSFSSRVTRVVPDPDRPDTIYLAGRFLWRSDDRGATWMELHRAAREDGYGMSGVAVGRAGPIAVSRGRVFLFDGSPTGPIDITTRLPGPRPDPANARPRDIARLTPDVLVIATDGNGVFATDDAGASFTQINTGLPTTPSCQDITATDSGRLFVRVGRDLYTADAVGTPWSRVDIGVGGGVNRVIATGETVVVTTLTQYAVSTDGGRSWESSPVLDDYQPRVSLADRDGSVLVGTEGFGLWRTAP